MNDIDITKCKSKKQFEELMKNRISGHEPWKEQVRYLIVLHNKRRKDVVNALVDCGILRKTANKMLNEIPSNRKSILCLAKLIGMNAEETNELLKKYAMQPALYSRSPSDAIWIFILNDTDETGENPFQRFERLYDEFKTAYKRVDLEALGEAEKSKRADNKGNSSGSAIIKRTTIIQNEKFMRVDSENKLMQELVNAIPVFMNRNRNLIKYMNELVAKTVGARADDGVDNGTINKVFAGNQRFKKYHYDKVRDELASFKSPTRAHMISFGLNLALSHNEIDKLLEMANMAPLCENDMFECAIMFWLEQIENNIPYYVSSVDEFGKMYYNSGNDPYSDMEPDMKMFKSSCFDEDGFPIGSLAEFIKQLIEDTELPMENEDEYKRKMIKKLHLQG